MKYLGIIILLVFYSVYLGKMVLQKTKGIQTDQMLKDKTVLLYAMHNIIE